MAEENPGSIQFHSIKSNGFRVVHGDGVWGGTTPRGYISMSFFSERHPIPGELIHKTKPNGTLDREIGQEAREGIIREVEVEVVVDLETAKSLIPWLQGHITALENIRTQYDWRQLAHSTVISALPDTPYTLLRPIPVHLEPGEDGGWTASFDEANIGMPGGDPEDARQMLADDIVETFALFLAEEETLGPGPKRQLAVLKQYLQVR